jgi:hypothetical protein
MPEKKITINMALDLHKEGSAYDLTLNHRDFGGFTNQSRGLTNILLWGTFP